MKRLLIFTLLVLNAHLLNAQAILGIKGGLDINSPISDALYQVPAPGYSVGLSSKYLFSPKFGIKSEIMYSRVRYGYIQLPEGPIMSLSQTSFNSTTIPIKFIWKMCVGKDLSIYLGIGPQYSRIVSGSAYVSDRYGQGELWEICYESKKEFDYPDFHILTLNPVNRNILSGIASIELQFQRLGIEVYYSKGINALTNNSPFIIHSGSKTLNKYGITAIYYICGQSPRK